MALRWLEGWEASVNMTHLARIYATATGSLIQEDGANEDAGEAVSSGTALFETPPLVGSPADSWIIGLAFRPDDTTTINNGNVPYVGLSNSDGEQIRFEFLMDNPSSSKPGGNAYKIRVMRGATELASSVQKFQLGAGTVDELWVYFEFKVTIDDSTGSFEGRYSFCRKPSMGQNNALSWDAANTSVDTKNQSSAGADRFTLSMVTGSGSDTCATDDIYVCDSSGSKNNDYLGRVVIIDQKPAGDGDTTDWVLAGGASSTQQAWDEGVTAASDDLRVTSDTTSDVHLATVDPLTILLGANTVIVGIRHDIVARMETTGDLDILHMFRKTTGTPAETDAGDALNVDSTTYKGHAVVLEDDPNTATDWDLADMNSYQYGVANAG